MCGNDFKQATKQAYNPLDAMNKHVADPKQTLSTSCDDGLDHYRNTTLLDSSVI